MKYRKKPVVVEAFKFLHDEVPQWWKDRDDIMINVAAFTAIIPTLEGDHIAQKGDYIIQGVKGELYACKPDIFEMTYEKVEE